jgi:hypothetical protein
MMIDSECIWLGADYHMPIMYSCRVPMNSISSASSSPAPGPATVRLALIRTGIELFGIDYTKRILFPIIRSMQVRIRPPERIALTVQIQRAYKANSKGGLDESVVYREFAHAHGPMTIFIRVPCAKEAEFNCLLQGVGYWGQGNSFATSIAINHSEPAANECGMPLDRLEPQQRIQRFFPCLVSEFRDGEVGWADLMPELRPEKSNAIRIGFFVWPLVVCERHRGGTTLQRRSMK